MRGHAGPLLVAVLVFAGLNACDASAGWEPVEDFDDQPVGAVSALPRFASGGEGTVFEVAADDGGRFLRSARSARDWKFWWTGVPLPKPIPSDSRAAGVYAEFRWRPRGTDPLDLSFGLIRAVPTGTADFDLYRVQIAVKREPDGLALLVRNGADLTEVLRGLAPDAWFQCWIHINAQAGTFTVFVAPIADRAGPEHQVGGVFRFRPVDPVVCALTHFSVMRASKDGATQFDIDNVWIDYQGGSLTRPVKSPKR